MRDPSSLLTQVMASAGTRHAVTLWFYDSRERAAAVAAGTVDGGGGGGVHTPALLSAAAGSVDTAADDTQAQAFIQVTTRVALWSPAHRSRDNSRDEFSMEGSDRGAPVQC